MGAHASTTEAWAPAIVRESFTYCRVYLLPCRVEVIRPIPVVICCVRTLRAIDTGMEPDEGPCPFRKCAQCDPGHQVERATADRPVAIPGVENDIAVL